MLINLEKQKKAKEVFFHLCGITFHSGKLLFIIECQKKYSKETRNEGIA